MLSSLKAEDLLGYKSTARTCGELLLCLCEIPPRVQVSL